MTTLPLMTTDISRVRSSEGQYLTAADFQTEQEPYDDTVVRPWPAGEERAGDL